MSQGIILKGIGGFYYVKTGDKVIECRAKGRFRNENMTPLVGDLVRIKEQQNGCLIECIYPRKNELIRPSVSNVDQAVIVFAGAKPPINTDLLDRFLLISEHNKLDALICINKIDLIDDVVADDILKPYKKAGYSCVKTSTLTGYGIDDLKEFLKGKVTVFAGPSGVGKSSILNKLQPSFKLKTGEISEKLERGKHTTRHAELLELGNGGLVVDTPGFSSLEIDFLSKEQLQDYFPEFGEFKAMCKFTGCSHISEPGCAVKEAVEMDIIDKKRYDSYVKIYEKINSLRRNYR